MKTNIFKSILLFVVLGVSVLIPVTVGAVSPLDSVCDDVGSGNSGVCQENEKSENANTNSLVGNIVNTLLFIIGAISVFMVIFGGILYVTSQGDSGNVTKAKNTILYAIVGLVVAFIAYAVVNWVFNLF